MKNAILFSNIDSEDGWVLGGLVFKVENTNTYEESYNEIKSKLETPEVIDYVIKTRYLLANLFDGDATYRFVNTYWDRGLHFIFRNSAGTEQYYGMTADYVFVP